MSLLPLAVMLFILLVWFRVADEMHEPPIDEASRCSIEAGAPCASAEAKGHHHPWLPDNPEVVNAPPPPVPEPFGWHPDMDAPTILRRRPSMTAALAAGSMSSPLPLLNSGNTYFAGMVVDGSSG